MFRFFKTAKKLSNPCRSFSTIQQVRFDVLGTDVAIGELTKLVLHDKSAAYRPVSQEFSALTKRNPNSLFTMTIPSKMMHGEYGQFPYPGHNSVFITDGQGAISSFLSKRPDVKQLVSERLRAPNPLLPKSYSQKVRIYAPRFTSLEEELRYWIENAKTRADFPLYIHRFPLNSVFGVDAATFQRNVDYILEVDCYYSLHSTLHPILDRYIPAQNCNDSVQRAIWGEAKVTIGDMPTQQAVMAIVRRFIKDVPDYQRKCQRLGLMDSTQLPPIDIDLYQAQFTC